MTAGAAAALLFDGGRPLAGTVVLAAYLTLPLGALVWRRRRRLQLANHLPQALRLFEAPVAGMRSRPPANAARGSAASPSADGP